MKKLSVKMQLGKNGVTENFVETLRKTFKNRVSVRIALLKAFTRDREEIKETAEKLCNSLKNTGEFGYIIIGFTIILKKLKRIKQTQSENKRSDSL